MTKPIPEGFHAVTPFLRVTDATSMIEFMQHAFGAVVTFRMDDPTGRVAHAELQIGDSMIMLGQAPSPDQAMRAMIHLYLTDTDAMYKSAMAAGATSIREPANQFYGDRSAGVKDPAGNEWWMATHIEDVTQQEMQRRMAAMAH
jgi:PhnB protein